MNLLKITNMKYYLTLSLSLLFSLVAFCQCPTQEFIVKSCGIMKSQIVQTFPIYIASKKDNKKSNKDIILFLTKGLIYEFVIFDDKDHQDELVLSLFNSKEQLLVCSFNETSGMKAKKIKFSCNVSGEYTLSYYMDNNTYCGVVLIGNIKKAKK